MKNINFKENETATLELPFSEHIEELRQRIFHIFWIILLLTCVAFVEVKFLVKILELPVNNVKFFHTFSISMNRLFAAQIKAHLYASGNDRTQNSFDWNHCSGESNRCTFKMKK